jgi:hypothetical protein
LYIILCWKNTNLHQCFFVQKKIIYGNIKFYNFKTKLPITKFVLQFFHLKYYIKKIKIDAILIKILIILFTYTIMIKMQQTSNYFLLFQTKWTYISSKTNNLKKNLSLKLPMKICLMRKYNTLFNFYFICYAYFSFKRIPMMSLCYKVTIVLHHCLHSPRSQTHFVTKRERVRSTNEHPNKFNRPSFWPSL